MTGKQRLLLRSSFFLIVWICLIVTLISMMKVWPTSGQWKMILEGARVLPILALFGCFLMATILRAIRWGLLLKGNLNFEWTHLCIWFPWAFFVITFSPFRTGELVKPLWVRSQGGSASMATGALIVERITDVLVLLFFISLVGIYAPIVPEWISVVGIGYLIVMIIIYLLVMMAAEPLYKRICKFNSESTGEKKIARWLSLKTAALMEGMSYIRDVKSNFMLLLITTFIWSAVALGFYSYLSSFFSNIHWTVAVAVMGVVNLSSLISLVPGNLGMFELTAVATLVIFSIPPSDALVATIGYHSLTLLFTVFCGSLAKLALQKKGQRLWEVI